ncbi:MAG: type VI secretion system baseplate subunit TssK, partial [Planctomycetales bacterium]
MRNPPVHWAEGMFLKPHHFQAAERFWSEQMATSDQWDHQYNYGVRQIEFSREALENQQLQVHLLHARMKDGSLISIDPGQEPDRVDLKESFMDLSEALVDLTDAFANETKIRVYLAVPKLKMGVENVSRANADNASHHRYMEIEHEIQDESSGGNDHAVQFKSARVKLLLSTQDLAGYELLPIAQIERAGEGGAVPHIDEDYFPPMLAVDAWKDLGRGIVRAIYDVIGKRLEVLSENIVNRGKSLPTTEPGDMIRVLMLNRLNEAYGALSVLAFAPGVHPFDAYTELCRIVGQLAIFGDAR